MSVADILREAGADPDAPFSDLPASVAIAAIAAHKSVNERAWYSVDDVSTLTGWSVETVQDKARRGLVPMFKIGRDWRITRPAFEAWEARVASENLPMEARYPRRA